jgi:hypothetical protein
LRGDSGPRRIVVDVCQLDTANARGLAGNHDGSDANARFTEDDCTVRDVPTEPGLDVDWGNDEVTDEHDEINVDS